MIGRNLSSFVPVGSGIRLAYEHGLQTYSFSPLHTFVGWPWVNVDRKFLGLEFMSGGQVHFGWAQPNVNIARQCDFLGTFCTPYLDANVTGYAYDTVPNQAIAAGAAAEPGTRGLLALGRWASASGAGVRSRRVRMCEKTNR